MDPTADLLLEKPVLLLDGSGKNCTFEIKSLDKLPPEATDWHFRIATLVREIPGGVFLNIPGLDGNPRYYLIRLVVNNNHQDI